MQNETERESKIAKLRKAKENLQRANNALTERKSSTLSQQQKDKMSELRSSINIDDKIENRLTELTMQNIEEASKELKEFDKLQKELKIKNGDTIELVFFFDRSGSCYGKEKDTLDSFWKLITKERKNNSKVLVTTILFDTEEQIINNRTPINKVEMFDYMADSPREALYDNLYKRINYIDKKQQEDNPKIRNTIFVIMSDGGDDSSVKYNLRDIKELIAKKRNDGWKFIYLGVGFDNKKSAQELGMDVKDSLDYNPEKSFKAIQDVLESYHLKSDNKDTTVLLEDRQYIKRLTGGNNE